jgi:putative NADH-flavin reductase
VDADYQGATADSNASSIELNYHAKNVYLVVGGTGSLTVTRDGQTTTLPVSGPPQARQIVAGRDVAQGSLQVRPSQGLQMFSFTYG